MVVTYTGTRSGTFDSLPQGISVVYEDGKAPISNGGREMRGSAGCGSIGRETAGQMGARNNGHKPGESEMVAHQQGQRERMKRSTPAFILLVAGLMAASATALELTVSKSGGTGKVASFSLDTKAARRITLQDWTGGRGFAPDLVNYTIDAPADGGRSLSLFDGDGEPLPVQVTPAGHGKATLSFVAEVPAGTNVNYWLRLDGQGAAAMPAVSAVKEGDILTLSSRLLAVRVPAPQEKTFETPVAAETLPAPVLAFRGEDKVWKGGGKLLSKRPVKVFTVALTAEGPVYGAVRYRLEYEGGGWYEATVRVTDRSPLAEVREEYDLGRVAKKNAEFWQLDLSGGWEADTAEHMNVAGQGFVGVTYPAIEQDAAAASGSQSTDFDLSGGLMIHHDSCWGSRFVSYYGIHKAEARTANPDGYALAMVAPLHKGEWRRANSLPVDIEGRQVRIRFPMDTAPTSLRTDPGTDTGPFSMHEHDPNLPPSRTRRVWGLVLAHPAIAVTPPKGHGSTCLGYSVRNLYGTVGLDRFKDFVLDWPFDSAQGKPDANVAYPRVFITPDGVRKYREALQADPNFSLATYDNVKNPVGPRYFYLLTGDPAVAQQEVAGVIKGLDSAILLHTAALSVGHHHALGMWGLPLAHAESVLAWPDLPAEARSAIRSRLALMCYLLTDPDVTSAGNGSHHGNPNMGIARLSDRSNVAALIPDHPMHRAWAEYMGDFLAYKQGTLMAPEGAWSEYGVSYHAHGYGKIARGLMGALADKVAASDLIRTYNRQDFDYFLNLLTPVDARFGNRLIPGMANSPCGAPMQLLQAMGNFADHDPEFAANLRWGWEEGGRMIGTGADGITVAAMARPEIPAREAKLTSRVYPGFGVIFRAHQGPDETCLYLRSGYNWSHWNFDQGNLICYSKGAALLPPQPYQYDSGKIDRAFPDKNVLRFGTPTNEMVHATPDSNILDARFSESVDYAWHSTGFPDWYFNPGAKPGLGCPRARIEAAGTTDGAFTWDRQVAFLKGKTGKSPNYFVIRDSIDGAGKAASWFVLNLPGRKEHFKVEGEKVAVNTEWPTKLDVFFPGRQNLVFEMKENRLPTGYREDGYFKFSRTPAEGEVISRDYVMDDEIGTPVRWEKWTGQRKQNPGFWDRFIRIAHNPAAYVGARFAFDPALEFKQQQVTLRLANAPGQDVTWVLYPRGAGEVEPTATQLAPGVTKVVTGEGTDYVFLSTAPFTYTVEGVVFDGTAGVIRVPKGGKPALVFSTGGKPKVEPRVVADGDKVRFVATDPVYVNLSHGNVGVRGVGPFDLSFTPDGITGTVDGGIRTIVCTWPEKIVRPGYWQDGVRWYAGFADEPSITKGQKTPQFSIAMGVSAGKHEVKIAEWTWPALPPVPARSTLALK